MIFIRLKIFVVYLSVKSFLYNYPEFLVQKLHSELLDVLLLQRNTFNFDNTLTSPVFLMDCLSTCPRVFLVFTQATEIFLV